MKVIDAVNRLILGVALLLAANFNAYSYDLLGNDFDRLLVTTTDQCAAACTANASCQAWTFVKPPLKHPTSAVCYLKNVVPTPQLNSVCTDNSVCLSGVKRSDGWCGETPLRNVGSSGVQGQNIVLSCAAGQSCRSKVTQTFEPCWIFFRCRGPNLESTDFFCQSP